MSKKWVLLILLMVSGIIGASAQTSSEGSKILKNPHFGGTGNQALDTQGWVVLDAVKNALDTNPPCDLRQSEVRKMALYNFDCILHNHRYDKSASLKDFISTRMQRVLKSLDTPVESGLRVYKIYNDGFLVKSKTVTVAFDLCGREGKIIPDSLMKLIVGHCDALFISHAHTDHADSSVVSHFLAEKKPVVAPVNFLPEEKRIIHQRDDKMIKGKLTIRKEKISYCILPGHQNVTKTTSIMCNHNIVTFPEKYTVAHLGDQAHKEDNEWISKAHEIIPPVNILFTPCFMSGLNTIVKGYNPKMIFTGHENEMGHPYESRVPFWFTYSRYKTQPCPVIVMGWGEYYDYQ